MYISGTSLDTPILLLVFNRQKTTAKVFEAIRRARPRRLFVAADGPRPHVEADAPNCLATRDIATAVDWNCEVKTLFRKRNLGCRVAVSSAITWFFQQVDEGIILEDDTLPMPGFFDFCQRLLRYYRDDHQVMHIGGCNFQLGARHGDGSYYFSIFNHIWGWATWRRAWKFYDPSLHAVRSFKRKGVLDRLFSDSASREYWLSQFERTARGEINTWDYPWTMSIWDHEGLSILPNVNMVSNIGFSLDATHTTSDTKLTLIPVNDAEELHHPSVKQINAEADSFTQRYIFHSRIENAGLLAMDVAKVLEEGRAAEGADLAQRFLVLHPEDSTLQWLQLLSLAMTGKLGDSLGLLESFLVRNPKHEGARKLLTSFHGKNRSKI